MPVAQEDDADLNPTDGDELMGGAWEEWLPCSDASKRFAISRIYLQYAGSTRQVFKCTLLDNMVCTEPDCRVCREPKEEQRQVR